MNRQILRLAVPNIITNITVPLLGMVDTAIAGHLDASSDSLDYIGAIAVGTMIFNIIYWNFGFLRMGTSGFTAQAYGANDVREQTNILTRACSVALISALLLIVLQKPISVLAASLIEDKNSVMRLALTYFFIRIWAAPATLGMYALKGWFIGMQDSKTPMWISILINILNIGFSLLFVVGYGMDIDGVAWGTVVAQYGGLLTTIALWLKKYGFLKRHINIRQALQWDKLKMFFKVNSDIFLRTICLVLVTSYFTVASSSMPYPTLAVNTILMQLFTLFSYFMDGFAYAAESLCGKFKGAGDYANLRKSVSQLLKWGTGLSMAFVVLYFFGGENILGILTDKQEIIDKSGDHIFWVLLIPVTGFVAFLYDGILIGMTETGIMRNAIFVATALFFVLFFSLKPLLGNDALWIGFITYLSARSILMALLSRRKIFING
ncbi:MAG TPA: MATE family efflux transporter [Candidatus Onthomorpha intestinigallinarum]|uniref:MATE family efflux transporter n=1 Tax=Candidatus Onthomorpha intestinigallinarum TaxID=2840880 RepID=A0A9D1UHR3_9BACT|nr:MATE family efflux transporter [Candidatus Onthomorpha intestinigallinarum]